jgi:hypothetical protein
MGLLDFGAVPEGGVKGPYADYSTALAALRADAGASDGDVYQLTDGRIFSALTGDLGWLLPPRAYGRASGLVVNATGNAEFAKADALAAVLARGWSATENGTGTATKSAAAALVVSAPSNGASVLFDFVPTANLDAGLILFKLTGITGAVMGNANVIINTGSKSVRLSVSYLAAGGVSLLQSGTAAEADQKGDLSSVTTPVWVAIEIDEASATTLQRALPLEGDEALVVERDEGVSTAQSVIRIYAANTTSSAHELQIEELVAVRYA